MRVVIDGRPLIGNRTGIGVHTAEIAKRLPFETIIASHKEIEDRADLPRSSFIVHRSSLGVYWQQVHLPRVDGDVLWGPHGTLPLASKIPAVATLHDFTSITMPGRHRLKTILSFNLFIGASLEKASRVACVSRAVADEAMRGFGVPASKLEIVPNGVDSFFSPEGDEEDFILYAGTLEPRKGLDDLLAVWSSLTPRPRLILCGDLGWRGTQWSGGLSGRRTEAGGRSEAVRRSEAGGLRARRSTGAEVTGYVSRERLRELYRHARAFVYPSRYEGFGIPPLEAMACGAPVIATRVGAIPEYAEGAAELIAPNDRDALRGALTRVLGDAALRRELRARGPERARLWGWERGAETMAELLGEAATTPPPRSLATLGMT